MVAIRKLFLLR